MALEHFISIASTIVFLSVAFILWTRGFRIGGAIVVVSIISAFAFGMTASFAPNLWNSSFDFHFWFRVLGLASTIGILAIGIVFFQVVKTLPSPSLKPTR